MKIINSYFSYGFINVTHEKCYSSENNTYVHYFFIFYLIVLPRIIIIILNIMFIFSVYRFFTILQELFLR